MKHRVFQLFWVVDTTVAAVVVLVGVSSSGSGIGLVCLTVEQLSCLTSWCFGVGVGVNRALFERVASLNGPSFAGSNCPLVLSFGGHCTSEQEEGNERDCYCRCHVDWGGQQQIHALKELANGGVFVGVVVVVV